MGDQSSLVEGSFYGLPLDVVMACLIGTHWLAAATLVLPPANLVAIAAFIDTIVTAAAHSGASEAVGVGIAVAVALATMAFAVGSFATALAPRHITLGRRALGLKHRPSPDVAAAMKVVKAAIEALGIGLCGEATSVVSYGNHFYPALGTGRKLKEAIRGMASAPANGLLAGGIVWHLLRDQLPSLALPASFLMGLAVFVVIARAIVRSADADANRRYIDLAIAIVAARTHLPSALAVRATARPDQLTPTESLGN